MPDCERIDCSQLLNINLKVKGRELFDIHAGSVPWAGCWGPTHAAAPIRSPWVIMFATVSPLLPLICWCSIEADGVRSQTRHISTSETSLPRHGRAAFSQMSVSWRWSSYLYGLNPLVIAAVCMLRLRTWKRTDLTGLSGCFTGKLLVSLQKQNHLLSCIFYSTDILRADRFTHILHLNLEHIQPFPTQI